MKIPRLVTGRSRRMPIFEFVALIFSSMGLVWMSDRFFKLDRLVARAVGRCEECGSKQGLWWPSRMDVLCPVCLIEARCLEALMWEAMQARRIP